MLEGDKFVLLPEEKDVKSNNILPSIEFFFFFRFNALFSTLERKNGTLIMT